MQYNALLLWSSLCFELIYLMYNVGNFQGHRNLAKIALRWYQEVQNFILIMQLRASFLRSGMSHLLRLWAASVFIRLVL